MTIGTCGRSHGKLSGGLLVEEKSLFFSIFWKRSIARQVFTEKVHLKTLKDHFTSVFKEVRLV